MDGRNDLLGKIQADMKTEDELAYIAEQHPDDEVANKAMAELRERFDSTYTWCVDCDGLVVKEKDCCLNRNVSDEISDEDIEF